MIIGRRSFLTGLLAAPLIVKATSLMPVRPMLPESVFTEMDRYIMALTDDSRLFMCPTKLIVPQRMLGIAQALVDGQPVAYS